MKARVQAFALQRTRQLPGSVVFFFVALLSLAIACSREREAPAAGYNVVLITLDTLRADHLGAYGYTLAVTPALDRLAREGVRFDQAISPVPLTLPSHATILSGMLPQHHGVRNNGAGAFPAMRETLATRLSAAGYRTGAFVGSFVLDRRFGLNRGFETYDDEINRDPESTGLEAERLAEKVVDRAIDWLGRKDRRPFFAWIHLYDAHAPYNPPEPFRARYAGRLYDGEIAYIDEQLARLMEELRSRELEKKTLIIIAGDHGEALGEHGELTHGLLLYEPTLRVPLIVYAPGVIEKGAVATPVSLADIAPTISSLVGTSLPASDGYDLSRSLLRGEEPPSHDIYSETEYPALFGWSDLAVLRRGSVKYIASPSPEMYNLEVDPLESENLYGLERRTMRALAASLEAMKKSEEQTPSSQVDPETMAKLASLGYIGGAPPARRPSDRPSPVSMVTPFRLFEEAVLALGSGRSDEAIHQLESLVKADLQNPVFRATLAKAYRENGQLPKAIDVYRESVAIAPSDPEAWYNLAATFQEAGDHKRAAEAIREAIRRDPKRPEAHNTLGIAYAEEGNFSGAEDEFRKTLQLDPRNARGYNNLGNVLRATGRAKEAERAYLRSTEIAPSYADPLNGLGALEVERDRPAAAIPYFDKAIALAPQMHEIRLNRAIAYQMMGNRSAARADYMQFISAARGDPQFSEQRTAAQRLLAQLSTPE